ncbi:calphotin-like [Anopheles maculipalpis]|uniref:calphotin-like n=1 Tax=Anopheles maculipalpis TaxID=1496333 RepID=UPI0021598B4B|nr:calphotin-like [Anopheles maculipalpis]
MAFKFVIFAAVVAVARAGLIASPAVSYAAAPALVAAPVAKVATYAAPIAKVAYAAQPEEYDPNPQYSFSYGISDSLTGDSKSQQESRSGDVVQGSYSVVDADGYKRTVDYTADPHNGFNAQVRREPLGAKVIAAQPAVAYAAPLATKTISYAAPVAKTISYAAPVATKTYVSSPAVSYAAPLATKTYVSSPAVSYAAPLATKTYVSSPAVSYAAPLATKTYVSSPALSYAAPAYASYHFVIFAAVVAVARAGLIASPAVSYAAAPALVAAPVAKVATYAAPIAKVAYAAQPEEYDPNPQYSFSYGISDSLTGDSKSQQESRSGDVVQGSYSVVDADGYKRTVDYTADPHNGFNAEVRREPLATKVIAAQPAVAYAAPLATKTISYAAPVAKTISYAAPVATKTYVSSPAVSYAAPLATKTYVSSPAVSYAAPLATKTYVSSPAVSYAAPLATKTYVSSPAVSYAAPLAKTYVSSPALSYAAPAYASYHLQPTLVTVRLIIRCCEQHLLQPEADMAFKFVTFAALIAVARAGLIASPAVSYAAPVAKVAYAAAPALVAAPVAKVAYAAQPEEYDANPHYSFSYGISDALTGDSKSQQESRSGDVVQGSYSVVDPDGTKRTVDYTADPHNGFNAVVHREPLTATKVVAAAPVATKVIAQPAVAYAAPLATKTVVASPAISYAAPVAKLAAPVAYTAAIHH